MSTAPERVVVTGIGATTPLGGTAEVTWAGLLAGTSGVRRLPYDWVGEYDLPVTFAATLATPADEVLGKVETRRLDPCAQYALVAAREAWADAGAPDVEPDRLAVAVGSGIGGVITLVDQWETLRTRGPRRIFPLAVPMLLANGPAATISLELNAQAGGHAPVSACASGAEAIGYALELIRSGRADVVVAGGAEAAIHPLPFGGFAAMQALSTRNDDPPGASRPFDAGRDGFVIGEGAAILVLESERHALARGVPRYAELVSMGVTTDAHHVAAPDPAGSGAARAMQEALQRGGLAPSEVSHLNAHATSTPAGDLAESSAIRTAFGGWADHLPVSATKSLTGHLLGAAGALEALFTVLAVRDRVAPAQLNLDEPDPGVALDLVAAGPRELPAHGDLVAMSNSFGFGGHNVSLAFRTV